VKHLSAVQLNGKLLTLPANIRLGWKSLPGTNSSQKFVNYGSKKFYNIGTSLVIMSVVAKQLMLLLACWLPMANFINVKLTKNSPMLE
jgi:hypothetical protein